ncbi:IclR family transcriptional regulator [Bacillus atrophaeus]|uniref:IclR family transcriptional regulator n=1 Tax=Bacillus atrophaeus TaxID=1452 RepID=UPI002281D350|nr:IclR family transcriptional regulator [Bacillus atrophaeus]MCY8515608.1 IclR family transcriptional regulator [Bacillus atrophaeus]MCY8992845.1 IclR family transcriptional regulator [Bacillus atrophaeus]
MAADKASKPKEEPGLRTVQRALDILYCFSLEKQELSLTEISREINLAMSTTTRLLATLEKNNFIYKDQETLKYRLGQKLYYLGHLAGKSIKLREIAQPILETLRDQTRETANLYLLEHDYRVCIEQAEGLQSIRHLVKIGEKLPLWAGAGGKVLLAHQPETFQAKVLEQLPPKRNIEELKSELVQIKAQGFGLSLDEREVGSAAIAAPIFNINGEVQACLSVSGPTHRFTNEVIADIEKLVKQKADSLSEEIGYAGKKE